METGSYDYFRDDSISRCLRIVCDLEDDVEDGSDNEREYELDEGTQAAAVASPGASEG